MRIIMTTGFITALVFSGPLAAQETFQALRDITAQQVDKSKLRAAVASRTLTWLTGSSSNNDYISVGRLANFFGFVALRVSSDHSLTRNAVAQDTLSVLSGDQQDALIALLEDQRAAAELTKQTRHQMNRALEGLLVGETISEAEFLDLGRAYGAAEAELGRIMAQRFGDQAQTLTNDQKDMLVNIRAAHISGQGDTLELQPARIRMPREEKRELTSVAARFLSWTTGSSEFNDFEVVGKPSQHFGFVSLRIQSNHGVKRGAVASQVLELLTPDQHQMLEVAVGHDLASFDVFLEARAKLMRTFETALSGKVIDTETVVEQGRDIGEIEAQMTWAQAQAMLNVRDSLSDAQSADLLAMRSKYTGEGGTILPDDPVERGRQLFAQCALCHSPDGQAAIGPDLTKIAGRAIASDPSYQNYSPALKVFAQTHDVWDDGLLDQFLQAPKSLVSGTTMSFDGFTSSQDRAAMIAFLKART